MARDDEDWLVDPAPEAFPLAEPRSVRDRLETIARLLAENTVRLGGGPRLIWRGSGDAVRCFPLAGPMTIGRDATCEIALDDPHVSHHHCRITRSAGGQWEVEDLHARNGTRVNGLLITRAALCAGDVIQAGRVELIFLA